MIFSWEARGHGVRGPGYRTFCGRGGSGRVGRLWGRFPGVRKKLSSRSASVPAILRFRGRCLGMSLWLGGQCVVGDMLLYTDQGVWSEPGKLALRSLDQVKFIPSSTSFCWTCLWIMFEEADVVDGRRCMSDTDAPWQTLLVSRSSFLL